MAFLLEASMSKMVRDWVATGGSNRFGPFVYRKTGIGCSDG